MKKLFLVFNVVLVGSLTIISSCVQDDDMFIENQESRTLTERQKPLLDSIHVSQDSLTLANSASYQKQTQNLSGVLMNGNDKIDRPINTFSWYYGLSINVVNQSYSQAQLNFAIYGKRANGTEQKLKGWYNDLAIGSSRTITIPLSDIILYKTQYQSLFIRLENDGWW